MITEFHPEQDCVTAVITSHMDSGENFEGAITLGVHAGSSGEIWMAAGGARFNIQCRDIPDLVKQLKRAAKIAMGGD